ncbi:unannotated protein [freshwater metagenome]|uniref:Unannotated protein n=1 Tax=freshwater metagenome TaxID=449393 RepID=A0A6J6YGC4_9ZZZZ
MVHCVEAVDEGLDLGREIVIRHRKVRPLRIATIRRNDNCSKNRSHWRRFNKFHIGVPAAFNPWTAGALLLFHICGALLIVEQQDLGVIRKRRRECRVARKRFTKSACEREVLISIDELITEEDHLPLQQG